MVCIIRDLATWAHIAQCNVESYEVPLFSVDNSSGKIVIAEEHPEFSKCWVIIDGNIFYGESASPSDGKTELTVSRPMNAFDRTLSYKQTLVYEPTSDSTMDQEKRYYELEQGTTYFRTSDDDRDPQKEYFLKDEEGAIIHEHITVFETGAIYFNKTADATYIKTSDQAMIPTKKYYEIIDNNYVLSDDISFEEGKDYYEKTSDATYSRTSDSSYNSSHTYYICDYYSNYIKINSTIFEEDGIYYESKQIDRYVVTSDTSFVSGKTYYELINSYGGDGTEVLETFIKHIIEDSFINESDPVYAMPYISVEIVGNANTVATLNLFPNEVYSFLDIIDLAYEKQVLFAFVMSASGITIYIFQAVSTANHVVFDDGHNFLDDVTISNDLVARVTVRRIRQEEESIEVDEEKDFYWYNGGEIKTIPPTPRIKGVWDIVSIEDEDIKLIEAAEESMANNDKAVKVSFYSDETFYLWDYITCLINNEVVTETVSSCVISSYDPRRLYTIGKMPTTLTDKFEDGGYGNGKGTIITNPTVTKSVTYENKATSYLEKTGGSVNGNIGVQDTTSTGKLVVGPDSYGSTLPGSGKTGQVFFVI